MLTENEKNGFRVKSFDRNFKKTEKYKTDGVWEKELLVCGKKSVFNDSTIFIRYRYVKMQ